MTQPFTSLGKQVLHGAHHYADACDPTAAEAIAAALNARHRPTNHAPTPAERQPA